MFASRKIPPRRVLQLGLRTGGVAVVWAAAVWALYVLFDLEWIRIPFLPLSVIGIAVSFYAGFKNNAAYDRFWEARKIWGGIVNESRSWANAVLSFVPAEGEGAEADPLRRRLVVKHLAWINALRLQLRKSSRLTDQERLDAHADHMRNDWQRELEPFLSPEELAGLSDKVNPATHILHEQSLALAELERAGRLNTFHQFALMEIIRALYGLQGQCERIKNTPLPRQYAEYSHLLVCVYVYACPFGLLDVFSGHLGMGVPSFAELPWLLVYLLGSGVIGWVFLTMEVVGDASEDPFERGPHDVPMNSLCRVIERDLLQLVQADDLPEPEAPIDGVLY